jgi:hypothetical protein
VTKKISPGDFALAGAVKSLDGKRRPVSCPNHVPMIAGVSLSAATVAIGELEATARLYTLQRRERLRLLTDEQVAKLRRSYLS